MCKFNHRFMGHLMGYLRVHLMGHLTDHLIPNYSILRKSSQFNIDITISMNILKYEFINVQPYSLYTKKKSVCLCDN